MVQRHPDLAALGLVRLPRSSADRDDRRPRLLGERCPRDVGASEDECARGCVHPLAVELERRAPALDEVKLLLQVVLLRLVVLVDEPIAHLMSCKRVDAERVMPKWNRTGRERTRPSSISPISSIRATA